MSKWQQNGDWLEEPSGRWKIARMDLHDGRRYCAWDFDHDKDWAPRLLAVRDSAEGAKKLIEVQGDS